MQDQRHKAHILKYLHQIPRHLGREAQGLRQARHLTPRGPAQGSVNI